MKGFNSFLNYIIYICIIGVIITVAFYYTKNNDKLAMQAKIKNEFYNDVEQQNDEYAAYENDKRLAEERARAAMERMEEENTKKATVNTASLNVRSGPGKKYGIITSVSKGDVVKIIDEDNTSWPQIELEDGRTGYVSSSYLIYQ